MKYRVRLDLDLIRRNLSRADPSAKDEDVLRALAQRGVCRRNDEWWGATAEALAKFGDREVIQKMEAN